MTRKVLLWRIFGISVAIALIFIIIASSAWSSNKLSTQKISSSSSASGNGSSTPPPSGSPSGPSAPPSGSPSGSSTSPNGPPSGPSTPTSTFPTGIIPIEPLTSVISTNPGDNPTDLNQELVDCMYCANKVKHEDMYCICPNGHEVHNECLISIYETTHRKNQENPDRFNDPSSHKKTQCPECRHVLIETTNRLFEIISGMLNVDSQPPGRYQNSAFDSNVQNPAYDSYVVKKDKSDAAKWKAIEGHIKHFKNEKYAELVNEDWNTMVKKLANNPSKSDALDLFLVHGLFDLLTLEYIGEDVKEKLVVAIVNLADKELGNLAYAVMLDKIVNSDAKI